MSKEIKLSKWILLFISLILILISLKSFGQTEYAELNPTNLKLNCKLKKHGDTAVFILKITNHSPWTIFYSNEFNLFSFKQYTNGEQVASLEKGIPFLDPRYRKVEFESIPPKGKTIICYKIPIKGNKYSFTFYGRYFTSEKFSLNMDNIYNTGIFMDAFHIEVENNGSFQFRKRNLNDYVVNF